MMGEALIAVEVVNSLLTLIGNAATKASQVSALIAAAQAQGRTTFTDAEWAQITGLDDLARNALDVAIKSRQAKPQG